jgi:hypothetical protein
MSMGHRWATYPLNLGIRSEAIRDNLVEDYVDDDDVLIWERAHSLMGMMAANGYPQAINVGSDFCVLVGSSLMGSSFQDTRFVGASYPLPSTNIYCQCGLCQGRGLVQI